MITFDNYLISNTFNLPCSSLIKKWSNNKVKQLKCYFSCFTTKNIIRQIHLAAIPRVTKAVGRRRWVAFDLVPCCFTEGNLIIHPYSTQHLQVNIQMRVQTTFLPTHSPLMFLRQAFLVSAPANKNLNSEYFF